jgi:hypothetical protein
MARPSLPALALLLPVLMACGSATHRLSSSQGACVASLRPAWATMNGSDRRQGLFVAKETGTTDLNQAERAAELGALVKAAQARGLHLNTEISIERVQTNGKFQLIARDKATAQPVWPDVPAFDLKGSWCRSWQNKDGEDRFEAWVQVFVPRPLTSLEVRCPPPTSGAEGGDFCRPDLLARVAEVLRRQGLELATPTQGGETPVTTRHAMVDVSFPRREAAGRELYVWCAITTQIVSTEDGAHVADVVVPEMKGGHYHWRRAAGVALENALEELEIRLGEALQRR